MTNCNNQYEVYSKIKYDLKTTYFMLTLKNAINIATGVQGAKFKIVCFSKYFASPFTFSKLSENT